MNPGIGKRTVINKQDKKPTAKAVEFIHRNTKKSIALKTEYLYLEDVKTAMNIHHLETNIQSKKWMIQMIKTNGSQDNYIPILENSLDKDRHKLQKMYKIKL
jgi:hypothetical protein